MTSAGPPVEEALRLARRSVEEAVDSALGEVRRQGGADYLLREARTDGINGAGVFLNALEAAVRSLAAERDALVRALGIFQTTLQPAGSPPSGGPEVLARWIADAALARAEAAEEERDEARERTAQWQDFCLRHPGILPPEPAREIGMLRAKAFAAEARAEQAEESAESWKETYFRERNARIQDQEAAEASAHALREALEGAVWRLSCAHDKIEGTPGVAVGLALNDLRAALRGSPPTVAPPTRLLAGSSVRGGETVHALPAGSTKPGSLALCGVHADPIGDGTPFEGNAFACKNCLRKLPPSSGSPAAPARDPEPAPRWVFEGAGERTPAAMGRWWQMLSDLQPPFEQLAAEMDRDGVRATLNLRAGKYDVVIRPAPAASPVAPDARAIPPGCVVLRYVSWEIGEHMLALARPLIDDAVAGKLAKEVIDWLAPGTALLQPEVTPGDTAPRDTGESRLWGALASRRGFHHVTRSETRHGRRALDVTCACRCGLWLWFDRAADEALWPEVRATIASWLKTHAACSDDRVAV